MRKDLSASQLNGNHYFSEALMSGPVRRPLTWEKWKTNSLIWLPERGMGYYNVTEAPYDQAYFAKYASYEDTPIGQELNKQRQALVERHYHGSLLDVGIGSGQFVAARPDTVGYDVNPAGVEWLKQRNTYGNLYQDFMHWKAVSFWDSLEHIDDPELALACVKGWVFVSLPIFEDVHHVLRSKHYRKDEHFWYWTRDGFKTWMGDQGFELKEETNIESVVGREDILSFAFCRPG